MKTTQGKPLMKSKVPYIFQLQYDEPGREAVKKVLADYKGTVAALNTFNPENEGPVKGSNVYSRFALGNAYRQITNANVRPINPRESEIALANDALTEPRGNYEDLGLGVYPKKGVNENLWKYLREQTKANFQDINLRQSFVITLADVIVDDKFENGLRLDFSELTNVYNVPILSKETGNFDSEDEGLQRTGFPSKLGQGGRTLYTANDGVRRLFRLRFLGLDANDDDLADSGGYGRVHFVENFSSGNLDEILDNLEQEKVRQIKILTQKYESAVDRIKNVKL